MSLTNKRELSLEYIRETTLPLIDGTGNYTNTIKKVSRNLVNPSDLNSNEFPAVFIYDNMTTKFTPMCMNQFTTGTTIMNFTDGMPVGLVAYVRINTQIGKHDTGKISTAMNNFYADIMLAMLSDYTLGGNCEQIIPTHFLPSLDWTEEHVIGVLNFAFSIKYILSPRATNPIV